MTHCGVSSDLPHKEFVAPNDGSVAKRRAAPGDHCLFRRGADGSSVQSGARFGQASGDALAVGDLISPADADELFDALNSVTRSICPGAGRSDAITPNARVK
jgi:hypothetical protein